MVITMMTKLLICGLIALVIMVGVGFVLWLIDDDNGYPSDPADLPLGAMWFTDI